MSLESEVADLTAATTALLTAVDVSKETLDVAVAAALAQAGISTTKAGEAAASAALAQILKDSLAAAFGGLSYLEPVAYTAGIDMTLGAQTVEYNGNSYAPVLAELPFTTSGAFEADKFRLVQGVARGDLAAPGGASIVGLAVGGKVQDAIKFVTPEMFGVPGASADDNALFTAAANAAAATGLPIYALGSEYRLRGLVLTVPARIYFGKGTTIRNGQTSGTKLKSLQFRGAGLQGTAVTVTGVGGAGVESSYHTDTVYVDDAAGFAVGQTVLLSENEPPQVVPRTPNPGETQDLNYREFATVAAVTGNAIQFTEYLRFPYSTTRSLTLQRVSFLEGAFVTGGKYIGRNAAGGAVGFEYCRYSGAVDLAGYGESDADLDRNGGEVLRFERCWECYSDRVQAKWTLFSQVSAQCQSCWFRNISGKRTSNGGYISSGDTFCHIGPIVEDSPGRSNGDGLGLANGCRHNTYGPFTISGARCYSLWLHQSCDDNTFLAFRSRSGITGGAYVFGDRNRFTDLSIKGHPSFGLSLNGDNNYANVDIDVLGYGVSIGSGTRGNRVVGRSVSAGTGAGSRDLLLGVVTDTVIDLMGGPRGMVYGTPTQAEGENHTNDIVLRGPVPYVLRKTERYRGWDWSNLLLNVSTGAGTLVKGPASSTDLHGLADLTTSAADVGTVYRIHLKTNSTLADSYSEYLAITRMGTWNLTALREGASSFAPRLQIVGSNLQVVLNGGAGTASVLALFERF